MGIALAVASSFKGFAVPKTVAAMGEIGLNREVRAVSFAQRRINEAVKLGFDTILVPSWRKGITPPENVKNLLRVKCGRSDCTV